MIDWIASIDVSGISWPLVTGTAVGLALLLMAVRGILAKAAKRRPATPRGTRVDTVLTMLVAGLATASSAQGMWRFFDEVLDVTNVYARSALFAFLELAILVSALRSRRHRIRIQKHLTALQAQIDALDPENDAARITELTRQLNARPPRDVDGIAVWVLALTTGFLSSLDAHRLAAKLFRLVAPLVSAWMWERGMIGEIRTLAGGAKTAKSWLERLTKAGEKLLVKVGLMDPTDADVDELAAQRRITKLVRRAHDFHTLPADAKPGQRAKAAKALRASFLDVQARGLLNGVEARVDVKQRLALLFAAETATHPDSLGDIDPWTGQAPAARDWAIVDADSRERADEALTEAARVSTPTGAHTGTGERDEVSAPVLTAERSPSGGKQPAAHVSTPADAHRSEPARSTSAAPTVRRARTERPTAAADALPEGAAPLDGVPGEVVAWIVSQWREGTDVSGSDIAAQFGKGASTGRRYRSTTLAHLSDLHKKHVGTSV